MLYFSGSCLISLGLTFGIAFAQVSKPTTRVPEFRADADLVLTPASVTDRAGHTVIDVGATDFTVLEDGKPREVVSASQWNGSASLGVIVDSSRSMRRIFQGAKAAAALLFADQVPGDEGSLISFGDVPLLTLDFTNDTGQVPHRLASILPQGATALWDAIYLGLNQMRQTGAPHKVLVVLTDCGENHSRYSFSEILAAVRESDVQLYAVDFIGGDFDRNQGPTRWKLKQLADETGGRFLAVYRMPEVPKEIALLNDFIRNQYLIAFRPQSWCCDGKWHQVRLRVQDRQKASWYKVFAKKGYYARGH